MHLHHEHLTTLTTVLQYWRLWQEAQGLSGRTIDERAAVIMRLVQFAGAHPLQLSPIAIMAYVGQPALSDTSRATYRASIRAYCKWLVATDQRTDDPSTKTPTPKRPKGKPRRPVFSNQLGLMLATVHRQRTRTMILLGALAGMRVHEIAKMHGADIDLANQVLTITGKAAVPRWCRCTRTWCARPTNTRGTATGSPPTPARAAPSTSPGKGSTPLIKGVVERAGIQGTPHQLRHWYGTTLLSAGVDVRVVQELMRHKSLDTTALYTLVDLDARRRGLQRLQLPAAA